MYLDYFGLTEKPFTITPNPRFLFLSKNHKEVFAHLLFGIRSRCGFVEVTGEVGTGKTTVLRTLLNQLGEDQDYRLALIFNPCLTSIDLQRSINREFGIRSEGSAAEELLSSLNDFLLRENRAGRTVVLVIDEAQNLEPAVLEQIRLLSNLETETDKLIQIVLVGQPELGELLARTELRQLSQRIAVRYHLRPMDFDDATAYIRHRMTIARGDPDIFTAGAMKKIFAFSKGFPRLINILGDRALVVGYAEGRRRISSGLVKTAIAELRGFQAKSAIRRFWPVLAMMSMVFGGLGFYIGSTGSLFPRDPAMAPEMAATASALPAPEMPSAARLDAIATSGDTEVRSVDVSEPGLEDLRRWLAGQEEEATMAAAAAALQQSWNMELEGRDGLPGELREFSRRVRENDMHLALFRGDLDGLLKLDSPALLEILLPGVAEPRYLALTAGEGDRMLVSPLSEGRNSLEKGLLGRLWSGRAFVPWRNFQDIPPLSAPGSQGEEVARLQALLKRTGVYEGTSSGIYDGETIASVTRLQAERGIVQDGRVGPRTLLLLYQEAGGFTVPRLGGSLPGDDR